MGWQDAPIVGGEQPSWASAPVVGEPAAAPAAQPPSQIMQRGMPIIQSFLRGGGPAGVLPEIGKGIFEGLEKSGQAAGGAVTDTLAGVSGRRSVLNPLAVEIPAEVTGAVGAATAVGLPAVVGGGGAGAAGRGAMTAGAERVMQSALKPTSKSLANGDAAKAITTMLESGVSMTAAGAAKLRDMITQLKGELGATIAQSPATVNKGYVFSELSKTLDDVTKQGLPTADREAVLKAWTEFKNHPLLQGINDIPVQLADTLKRGTQQSLKDFYRRAPTSSAPAGAEKSQAAIASGLRQGIEDAVPGAADANARLSQYINALHQIEPRAAIAANNDLGGLVPLAPTPEAAMLMLADRNPWMRSLIARVLHGGRDTIPAGAGATGAAAYGESGR